MLDDCPVVARIPFADGRICLVYAGPDGRQFVIGDDGDPVYGVWYLPLDGADEPIKVHQPKSGQVPISPTAKDSAGLQPLLDPVQADAMEAWPVSKYVNNAESDGPSM
jgi:hypothetical protein